MFRLVGHCCATGQYPSAVVPIGYWCERLSACHRAGGTVFFDAIDDEFDRVIHSDNLRQQLVGFDPMVHGLFAHAEDDVELYERVHESEFYERLLNNEKIEHVDPFVKLAFAKVSNNGQAVAACLRDCALYLNSSAPGQLNAWFEHDVAELREA